MYKKLTDYPLIVQVITIPLTYTLAIFKILVTIPIVVISKCNKLINDTENKQ